MAIDIDRDGSSPSAGADVDIGRQDQAMTNEDRTAGQERPWFANDKAVEPEDWSDKFPAKAACPTCNGSGKIPESNTQGSYDRKTCWKCNGTGGQEEAAEPRADGKDEYTVTRRWLQKLRDCLKYSFEPGANLPVAIGMVDHALEGCGPPDDVCPVSPQELLDAASSLDPRLLTHRDVSTKILKVVAWLKRGRV